MANHKSSIKSHKQSLLRNERNTANKSKIKTMSKKLEAMIESGDCEKAASFFSIVNAQISKSVTKGVYKLNTASRKISRLAKKLKQAQGNA